MKRTLTFIINGAAVSAIGLSALAQNSPHSKQMGTGAAQHELADHQPRVDRLRGALKASEFIGMEVKNKQGEKLGDVNNVLLDLASGRLVAVVVSSGGFLGMGDELSAVPPSALRLSADQDTLMLDATKESLANAPHFNAKQWPDFTQSDYTGEVYHAYKVAPYFAHTESTTTDNTGRTVIERIQGAVSPPDQGNNETDLATTAEIRKGIMAEKTMSVNGRKVKVTTNNGQVTLRGLVSSEDEKRRIGVIANTIAQAENVDNQLEVEINLGSN